MHTGIATGRTLMPYFKDFKKNYDELQDYCCERGIVIGHALGEAIELYLNKYAVVKKKK